MISRIVKSKLIISPISHPSLIKAAKLLNNEGIVIQQSNYLFLKIEDVYIHALHDFLHPIVNISTHILKPDYFTAINDVGAHISIIYPEEQAILKPLDLNQQHTFEVQAFCKATLDSKVYYVLLVHSASLQALRRKYSLAEQPIYKGNSIPFHITIGVVSK